MTELDKLKLPVPNPYGKTVKIERVNMLIERAYKAGQATARAEGAAAERERMSILLGKLKLTEDSLYNYYDVEKDPSVATKMTKSYNAALVEVGEALTTKEHHAS